MAFKKGQSGNPSGRPKRLDRIADALAKFDKAAEQRIQQVIESGEDRDAVAAIKLVWAYRHGLPRQTISGEDGQLSIGVVILPPEELD